MSGYTIEGEGGFFARNLHWASNKHWTSPLCGDTSATLNTHVAESRKRANKNYNRSTLTNALTTKHKILDIKGGLDKGLCYTYVQLASS